MERAGKGGGITLSDSPSRTAKSPKSCHSRTFRHSCAGGNPAKTPAVWIPAFAGMTEKPNVHIYCRRNDQKIDLSIFFATPCIYIGEPLE